MYYHIHDKISLNGNAKNTLQTLEEERHLLLNHHVTTTILYYAILYYTKLYYTLYLIIFVNTQKTQNVSRMCFIIHTINLTQLYYTQLKEVKMCISHFQPMLYF